MSLTDSFGAQRASMPSVTPEAPATHAARLLATQRIGSVPVQDHTGRVVGIVSEHDIVRVVATRALGLRGLAVEDVMTREPVTMRPETPAAAAIEMMERGDLRHLPICSAEGRLLGLVGLGELARRA